jgi:RimJ/RimL family protein N-acetyltransferase
METQGADMQPVCFDKYYWQNDLVRLRAMIPEDWERAYYNMFDSKARRLLQQEIELPPVAASVQAAIQKWVGFDPASGRLMFTIETLDGKAVGALNLNSIDERNGTFAIGMQIDVGQRGKGYGTAAMRILLGYAFFERRLNKYNCYCVEGNVASMTMLKKLGSVQEGVGRQNIYTDGRYMDAILFGLTKDDFVENERAHTQRRR